MRLDSLLEGLGVLLFLPRERLVERGGFVLLAFEEELREARRGVASKRKGAGMKKDVLPFSPVALASENKGRNERRNTF